MANKHIVELLIEANKQILEVSNELESENAESINPQLWIDDINNIIRKLDHIVEQLEQTKSKP